MPDRTAGLSEGERVVCPVCGGKGWNKITWLEYEPRTACTCGRCGGTGKVRR